MTKMVRSGVVSIVCGAVLCCAMSAAASPIVVPSANAAVEGNSNNGFPFNPAAFGQSAIRYQQVYSASDFGADSLLITDLFFRPDSLSGAAFAGTLSSIQIDLSTTAAAPYGLSSTFANNVGADNTTVFNGALSLSSAFTGPTGGPKAFDIHVALANPFLYNPTAGNLLLDVRNFTGGSTTQFDATFGSTDTSRLVAFSSGAITGTADAFGLVTEFAGEAPTAPVPEPASMLLLGTGLVGSLMRRSRRA